MKVGGRDLIWVTKPPLPEQTEEERKHTVTIVDIPAEIQTGHLPNASYMHDRLNRIAL